MGLGMYLAAMVVGGLVGSFRADTSLQRKWAAGLAAASLLASVSLLGWHGERQQAADAVAGAATLVLAVVVWMGRFPWRTRILSVVMISFGLQLIAV